MAGRRQKPSLLGYSNTFDNVAVKRGAGKGQGISGSESYELCMGGRGRAGAACLQLQSVWPANLPRAAILYPGLPTLFLQGFSTWRLPGGSFSNATAIGCTFEACLCCVAPPTASTKTNLHSQLHFN